MQRDKFLGVAIIIAGTLVAAGVAFASIPGPDGTIAGCYLKSGGRLRVIDKQAGQKCTSKEVAISLSQQGPPGGDGADGSPGPQGLPGEEGPPGPTAITDRIRLASPPFVPGVESPVDVPFSAAEWTQRAGTLNTLYGRVTATNDDVRRPGQVTVNVDFKIDGAPVGSTVRSTSPNKGRAHSTSGS